VFSYLSPEQRVHRDHPLRAIRILPDQALSNMSERFDAMYAKTGICPVVAIMCSDAQSG
jgi:hypothetical protein